MGLARAGGPIALPQAAPPESAEREAKAPVAPSTARVLVIEDQEDARDSLRMLLELDDHAAETAAKPVAYEELKKLVVRIQGPFAGRPSPSGSRSSGSFAS